MFRVLIHVRVLNLHVGTRLGASLDISVDLSLNCWTLKRVKQIPLANQTDVMGGPYWPLVSFSLITFLIEVIYIPAQKNQVTDLYSQKQHCKLNQTSV